MKNPIKAHEWITTVENFDRNTEIRKNGMGANPIRKAADGPGCYAFFLANKCLYVGSSTCSVRNRVIHHIRYDPNDYSGAPAKPQVAIHRIITEAREKKKTVFIRLWQYPSERARIEESLLSKTLNPLISGVEWGR